MEQLRCTKEPELAILETKVKLLIKNSEAMSKRIDSNTAMRDTLSGLDKNLAIQTELLKYIVERNDKQDYRMDKQDDRLDRQDEINIEQHEVMIQMSQSLSDLSTRHVSLIETIRAVETTQQLNESRQMIHTGEWVRDYIIKIGFPLAIIGGLIAAVYKIFECIL